MAELHFADLLQAFYAQTLELSAAISAVDNLGLCFQEAKETIVNFISQDEVEKAAKAVDLVWEIANCTGYREHQALAHWGSAIFFFNRNVKQAYYHAGEALSYYQETQQREEEGRLLFGYADLQSSLGYFDEAERSIWRSIECLANRPDYPDWPGVYINLAHIQTYQGHYLAAIESAKQAERIAVDFGAKTPDPDEVKRYQEMRAQALVNQGWAALFLGDFDTADCALREAQQLANLHGFSEIAGRAILNRARLAITQGELFAALQLLRIADAAFQAAQLEIDQATVAIERAKLYERLSMTQHARQKATEAADRFAQAGIVVESVEASLLAVRFSLTLGESNKARSYLLNTQKLWETAPPLQQALWRGYRSHPLLQNSVDQRHQALRDAEQALKDLHQLRVLNERLEVDLIVAQLANELEQPNVDQRLQQIIEISSQGNLGALEQQACMMLAQLQPLSGTIQTLRRAADIVAELRSRMPVEELKANLLTGHATVYTQLIEAQLKSHQYAIAMTTLLEAKGGIWADLVAPADAQEPSAALMRAKTAFNFWSEQKRRASEPEYRDFCDVKIEEAKHTINEIARYQVRLRSPQPLPSLTTIQQHLSAEAVALEYLVGKTHIWGCILTSTAPLKWIRLCKSTEIAQLQGQLATLLEGVQWCQTSEQCLQATQAQQPWVQKILQQLYNRLIAPFVAYLPTNGTLMIAPDHYLFETPWTALHDGTAYLSERYTITLVPSTALPALNKMSTVPTASPIHTHSRALGHVGDPPLKFIEAELAAIQRIIPNLITANPATSKDLNWKLAPSFLHIDAHGHIDRKAPLLSSLELADGPFLLADVFNLNLHGTQLVTLSACNTGTTPEQGGIALALSGAFLCAGAQSVLASLWPVDDQATYILMTNLYNQLLAGWTVSQALQRAQQEVRNAGYQHPYYWAAFQPLVRAM